MWANDLVGEPEPWMLRWWHPSSRRVLRKDDDEGKGRVVGLPEVGVVGDDNDGGEDGIFLFDEFNYKLLRNQNATKVMKCLRVALMVMFKIRFR